MNLPQIQGARRLVFPSMVVLNLWEVHSGSVRARLLARPRSCAEGVAFAPGERVPAQCLGASVPPSPQNLLAKKPTLASLSRRFLYSPQVFLTKL